MRLIDADAFERNVMFGDEEDLQDVIYALRDFPTAYDIDKVVNEKVKEIELDIQAIRNNAIDDFVNGVKEILEDNTIYNMDCIYTLAEQLRAGGENEVEKIVQEVAEEYTSTDDWIACSDRLPEQYEVLCCDRYGEIIVGHPYINNASNTMYAAESDNEIMYECIAWQPLPEPYRESD